VKLRRRLVAWLPAALVILVTANLAWAQETPPPNNAMCLGCHNIPSFSMPGADGEMRSLHVTAEKFNASVHGDQACVDCHQDVQKVPHEKGVDRKVGCVQCHRALWDEGRLNGTLDEDSRLGKVVEQIESYMNSIHARPSLADQGRTNATCYNCHDAHYVMPINGEELDRPMRLATPEICGQCHADIAEKYKASVHGTEQGAGNVEAAVCIDCHTPHNIESPSLDSNKLIITQNCGNCHEESAESYLYTYHGQVNKLGYAFTAKCFDCHGSHDIKRLEDPAAKMHADNRLQTCRTCHEGATEGYASFQPHGTAHDFDKYPQMWIATKFMIGLLIGTFAFFWLHSALWFYREYRDRKEGKNRPHIDLNELPEHLRARTHFRRFPRWWRVAHLIGALSIMTLVLTGVGVLYSESSWAPGLIAMLGGPQVAAYVHRVAAIGFMGVFFVHLFYFAIRIGSNIRSFNWFGPNSLIPNWQDLKDAIAMFRWFLGVGERPRFERWTYWEKFDYWAPFWGMTIIGISGLMMWFPEVTATYLPGWVFNVATIVHGEEAFLAAVFLFTVHFFNNHFRPDNFPQSVTMFTGRMPLETYRHEHRLEYDRLLASGELENYLVDAPTAPQSRAAKTLGAVLIVVGLALLTLVILGFLGV
jgi:thiosulfate reductase cytochrome b subunit/nitrate/TMAO reductase-like tetraheme cytochrome c subunit